MLKRNYQIEMDEVLSQIDSAAVPSLLLHSCCAPCSSYVLSYLAEFFNITVLYYNPNIFPEEEYIHRLNEQERLISLMESPHPIKLIKGDYFPGEYERFVAGLENEREGGARCRKCFEMRLGETARLAAEKEFDYFATTLTVSPHKNAPLINEIGERLADEYGVKYLVSDFKKKGGYLKSTELSKQYDLYRQNYCGCRFAMEQQNMG